MAFYHLFSGATASPSTQSVNVNICLSTPGSVFNESCGADVTVVICMKSLSGSIMTLGGIAEICWVFSVSTCQKFIIFFQ